MQSKAKIVIFSVLIYFNGKSGEIKFYCKDIKVNIIAFLYKFLKFIFFVWRFVSSSYICLTFASPDANKTWRLQKSFVKNVE